MKENSGAHDNNASESHKLKTIYVLCLLFLKTTFFTWDNNAIAVISSKDPPHDLPAALSKIYTSGNVNMFEECFPSSAEKPRKDAIVGEGGGYHITWYASAPIATCRGFPAGLGKHPSICSLRNWPSAFVIIYVMCFLRYVGCFNHYVMCFCHYVTCF